jgi:transcription initiation factor TFIIIB Brf1 subunit/transcription initiation factor TFIIB
MQPQSPPSTTCHICKTDLLVMTDPESGEDICNKCGMIVLDRIQNINQPEWRAFSNEEHEDTCTISEFDFQKNIDNVKVSVKQYEIKYPVLQDNNYGIWNAYGNQYWPRDYLIDNQGLIRYDHVGKELALANEEIKQNGNMQIEFINIASHELRTPIQPLLGLTQIIRSRIKDTEQIELLDSVIRNAKRLKQLTDDIFNVTRIESHSLNLNKEQFDLNKQIEVVINDIKNQINIRYNNNAIKLLFEAEGNGVSIKADKVRIHEVISNLLNNAIKFTNEGTIYITTEKKKKLYHYLLMHIEFPPSFINQNLHFSL